ncbi:MAG: hypothetical protein KJO18_00955, partial [Acidimicrobiia bacterium]|nr:hypothetical protein [Acidimicrobiia bacterium]
DMTMTDGRLTTIDGVDCYRIDGLERMEPFLVSVVSASDLWMFASSHGSLTAGRTDADRALLPYETDDRLHRSAGITGPVTIIACEVDGRRELWQPFGNDRLNDDTRSIAKAVNGDRLILEARHAGMGLTYRATWAPSPAYGWVRTVELENHGEAIEVEVLDGLVDVMPSGVEAPTEQLLSNLVDAYKRSETGPWGSVGIFTLEALVTDKAEPAESLAANVVWATTDVLDEVHLDERVIDAMVAGSPWPAGGLLTGRRGSYLLRGNVALGQGQSTSWTIVADAALDHGQVLERVAVAASSDAVAILAADISAGADRMSALLQNADAFQQTGDSIADAHHLSNVMFNVMRGGLFPHNGQIPVEGFVDHLETWNRDVYLRHGDAIRSLGEWIDLDSLRSMAAQSNDPHLVRLVLEYMPLGFSRRHGDPSRPWNRFYISSGNDDGDALGYEGNWRDIFQNWEALLLSQPRFIENAVAKFVNASTVDGHNPYRISQDGIDWEEPDPEDPWSNIGYWGDHQIVYLHRLLNLWERFQPGRLSAWLDERVFVYADVPYSIAEHSAMVRDPRDTISFDRERADRVDVRVGELGSDGKLVVDGNGDIVQVGLFEKLMVPLMAKLTAFVPGGGIWMNTQRPEWNDANNALAGYGLSMVTLYHLYAYVGWLRDLTNQQSEGVLNFSTSTARWLGDLTDVLASSVGSGSGTDDVKRRKVTDALGTIGDRYRSAAYGDFDPAPVAVDVADILRLLDAALTHLGETIAGAARSDGLYESYNVVSFPTASDARVSALGPMLEGQVAVLSSGALDGQGSLAVIDALYKSDLYREDQHSFMLYPIRELPSFLDRNSLPANAETEMPFLNALTGSSGILVRSPDGGLHFTPEMVNETALRMALERGGADPDESRRVMDLYESIFRHHSYTGRSGSMHGYEGIGSIYWHMVGKLLVAVQETYAGLQGRATADELRGLAEAYRNVRSGLGFLKDPAAYGAIPTDCYSHTPLHAGAKLPGMTGQVKEEVLARFAELGLRIDAGQISVDPDLLPLSELMGNDGA